MNVAFGKCMMLNGFWSRSATAAACALVVCTAVVSASARQEGSDACVVTERPTPLPDLAEASGLTLSRRAPGLLWSHNDSGQPVLFAFDASGGSQRRVRIPNATVADWEDVTAARCASGHCLYIADIGDNDGSRPHITVYRIPEPAAHDGQSAAPDVFTARYPDGAHDAEALFVAGDDVFIVTKDAKAGLYRFPQPMQAGAAMTLERVAELPLRRVTDADVSSDGAWVAIRTGEEVAFYRTRDVTRGGAPAVSMSLRALNEPQGEGVALDGKGMLYLSSEAGGKGRTGHLAVLRCTLPK